MTTTNLPHHHFFLIEIYFADNTNTLLVITLVTPKNSSWCFGSLFWFHRFIAERTLYHTFCMVGYAGDVMPNILLDNT